MSKVTRVLHVVYSMGRGGIETWLMNVLRHIDRTAYQFDFLAYTNEPAAYDEEVRALGSRILVCAPPSHIVQNRRDTRRIIAGEGPYDVIHAHSSASVGLPLREAARAGIPVRISHSHNSRDIIGGLGGQVNWMVNLQWMHKHATHGLGCSESACLHRFGPRWRDDSRYQVLHYGMDWSRFCAEVDVGAVRERLGLPREALVVGHVGRFSDQKNHRYWLQVAKSLAERRQDVYFVLVGDGELFSTIEAEAQRMGLGRRIVFTGERPDVPVLMKAMDVFLFPSHYEGLPVALLEAQASDLPCVITDCVSVEADVLPNRITRVSLSAPPQTWADAVLRAANQSVRDHRAAWKRVANSSFSISRCVQRLEEIYHAEFAGQHVRVC